VWALKKLVLQGEQEFFRPGVKEPEVQVESGKSLAKSVFGISPHWRGSRRPALEKKFVRARPGCLLQEKVKMGLFLIDDEQDHPPAARRVLG